LRLGILASPESWYFRDLERAARLRGDHCTRLDFARLFGSVTTGRSTIQVASSDPLDFRPGEPGPACDAVLVRTMPPGSLEQVIFRMNVLGLWQSAGIRVVNSPRSLECAVDKYLTTARLAEAGLPVPATMVCEHEDEALAAFESLGRDVVVKPLFGAEGRGILRVSDPDLAHRTFRTLMRLSAVLYLQEFIDHEGFDIRVLVLGGKVLGAMRRRSPHDFRTNVARQAIAESHEFTEAEARLAIRAAACTGTEIAGVDLLYDRSGQCFVIEVNAVPGWQAFSRTTGIDVAACLLEWLATPSPPDCHHG